MLDKLDLKILDLLKNNAKTPLKKIGETIHLTPQGVSNRIIRLQNLGVITQYTIRTNDILIGKTITAYITVFMKSNDHDKLIKFIRLNTIIVEAHRISGEGCYLIKITACTQKELLDLLDEILHYGNYKVNLSIDKVK
ncbi:AsnC family transcriptional regulator [Acetoanaerobium noterae]|uniref:AsnC family transcriptional regulator n=1 Tax=Acetoanaerobium noterae TaxID=745369 RepID=UPI0028AFBEE7|nr:AsnC family transcriptional regulator [Acetoanaerobium noterae]